MRTRLAVASFVAGLAIGLVTGALLWGASDAQAKDERPSEIPYDTTDGIPALDPSYRHTEHKVVIITDHDLKLDPPRNLTERQRAQWDDAYGPRNAAFREADLEGDDLEALSAASWQLQGYRGVSNVMDDLRLGKPQFSVSLQPGALASALQSPIPLESFASAIALMTLGRSLPLSLFSSASSC